MGILEILIIIALILFPLGELARINIIKDVTLHPVDLAVFLISISWIIIQLKNKKNLLKITNFKPVAIFALICFTSLILNSFWLKVTELIASGLYLFRWFAYAGIYFALRDTKKTFVRKLLPRILIFDGLFIIIVGFLQILFYPSLLALERFQWDRHIYRMVSVFLDPNYAGAFFTLYLMLVVSKFFEYYDKKKYKASRLFGLIGLITLVAIYITFSRSALLMLLGSITLFLILINRKKYILFLLITTAIYVIILSPKFYIENLNLFRINSSMQRIESSKTALLIIEKNLVFGVGFDTYHYAQERYGFHPTKTNFSSHADAGTDNSFLFVTATTGIVGLITYISLWFHLLKKTYRRSKDKNNYYAACVLSSSIGLSVNALFINSLFFTTFMLWMWILIGTIDSR